MMNRWLTPHPQVPEKKKFRVLVIFF